MIELNKYYILAFVLFLIVYAYTIMDLSGGMCKSCNKKFINVVLPMQTEYVQPSTVSNMTPNFTTSQSYETTYAQPTSDQTYDTVPYDSPHYSTYNNYTNYNNYPPFMQNQKLNNLTSQQSSQQSQMHQQSQYSDPNSYYNTQYNILKENLN